MRSVFIRFLFSGKVKCQINHFLGEIIKINQVSGRSNLVHARLKINGQIIFHEKDDFEESS